MDQPRRDFAVAAACSALTLATACGALTLAIVGAAHPAHAGVLELTTHRDGDAIEISARAPLAASAESAWRVLTDYERYTAFIPDLQTSKIVSRAANQVVVEQRGEVRFLWRRLPMIATLAVTETPPMRVESRLMRGSMRELLGRYELIREPSGLVFVYTGRVVPEEDQRSLFDHVAIRVNITRQLEAMVREIERVGAGGD